MKFRLKAFGLHLLGSTIVLTLMLGALYLGWYHWPGWYLADALKVVAVMIGVDLVLGPSITFIIANAKKSRRELGRDIGMIVTVQLIALIYGTTALWHGRPLYYAFSENCLQVVQAYDIDAHDLDLARQKHMQLVPHWNSLPRWIWAPLPQDPEEAQKIMLEAIKGGTDVIGMPQYYKPWNDGLPMLRTQLKKVDDVAYFSKAEKKTLKERMRASGIATDQRDAIPLTGRGHPLHAVIDPTSLKLTAIFTAT
jgi:hypothetical protein